eukprot:15341833-Ditylum_brightwellii.AAC.1
MDCCTFAIAVIKKREKKNGNSRRAICRCYFSSKGHVTIEGDEEFVIVTKNQITKGRIKHQSSDQAVTLVIHG